MHQIYIVKDGKLLMEELISIVVPIYNVEKYLEDCLISIINQTYSNLEIILVDDGSKDNCGQICDEYAKKDNRIQVIHKENGGLSDARNCGMALAKGRYISFIDADDFIHARFIEILLELAKDKQAEIVVGDFSLFQEAAKCKDKMISETDIKEAQILSEKHLYDEDFINRETVRFTVAWGKLYERKLWEGIEYPVGKIHEDTFTTYKLMERAKKVVYLKEPLYYWRENPSSITRGKFTLAHLLGLDAFQEQLVYFHNAGKQRHVEIVYNQYRDWFFWCYNEMQAAQIDYKKELEPYYEYMRRHLRYVKLTKSLGVYRWLKYRYLVYYKIPQLLK